MGDVNQAKPGFQGSETTTVQVIVYPHGNDPVIGNAEGAIEFDGRRQSDLRPSVIGVETNKPMGPASGTWSVTIKPPQNSREFSDVFDTIVDDDWIDIVFLRHNRPWHVMRGIVDDVREAKAVTGKGVTANVINIIGRDFGKIWEQSQVWFSVQAGENIYGNFASRVFTTLVDQAESSLVKAKSLEISSPEAAVQGYLLGFLEGLEDIGRTNWTPPPSMPGVVDGDIIKTFLFNNEKFSGIPRRKAIDPNFLTASGNLWDLAKEWSDPLFTELWVDLGFSGTFGEIQGIEMPISQSKMIVYYRDKPFPLVDPDITDLEIQEDSPWFELPMFIIPRKVIKSKNIGRAGLERFNAFFITSPLHQEALGMGIIDLQAPLWDKEDILRHGLRRFDVQTKYAPPITDTTSFLNVTAQQRYMIRDWYAINPYLLSGTIELGVSMPDIRIGSKIRIPGVVPEQDETYYVEQVSHSWQFGRGARTVLGVTRGWKGPDYSLLLAMDRLQARYVIEPLKEIET